jgi:nicotinamide-nucleotide amidase
MWSAEPDGAVPARVLEALASRGETLATAESLTGGLLSAQLTDVPGASRSLVGGVVSYATRVKVTVLGVPPAVVEEHGVVSEECAVAMARGVRDRLDATWGLATTGVAGPGQQEGRPVGTVWVAVAGPAGAAARLLDLPGDRSAVRAAACAAVLQLLDHELGE